MRDIEEINKRLACRADCEGCSDYQNCEESFDNFCDDVLTYTSLLEGISLDRLEAICAAEKDGRCEVLLPIDKDVYIIQDGEIMKFRVYNYSLLSVNNGNVRYWAECISDENEDDLDFWQDEIGESVFLTRAEAEKALGKEQGHDD